MSAVSWCIVDRLAIVAAAWCVTSAGAQTTSPTSGVPLDLARDRARLVSELRYDMALVIPGTKRDPIVGRSVMRFRLADATRPLVLDFDPEHSRSSEIRSNGTPVRGEAVNGHLVVPASALRLVDSDFCCRTIGLFIRSSI